MIRAVAKNVERPIIFPLSNPTDKAECTPEQAYTWTDGRALVACGVQFPDVTVGGKTYHPGEAAIAVGAPNRMLDLGRPEYVQTV